MEDNNSLNRPPITRTVLTREIKTILVAEDNYPCFYITSMYLAKDTQAEIIRAENGREALKFLQGKKIDMLITGIGLPEIDGIEVAKTALALDCQLPIIIVSANMTVRYNKDLISLGINNILLKPVKEEEFRAMVRKFLPINA